MKFNAYTSNTQTTQSSNADIYVPFPVREILVKGVDLDFNADFKTMYFTSSLVDGNYVGSGFAGSLKTSHLILVFKILKKWRQNSRGNGWGPLLNTQGLHAGRRPCAFVPLFRRPESLHGDNQLP